MSHRPGVLWSPSYLAASCGGALISIVRQYTPVHRTAEQSRLDPSGVCAILPRPERAGLAAHFLVSGKRPRTLPEVTDLYSSLRSAIRQGNLGVGTLANED